MERYEIGNGARGLAGEPSEGLWVKGGSVPLISPLHYGFYPSGHTGSDVSPVILNKGGGRGACPWSHAELLWLFYRYCPPDGPGIHSWGSPNCSFILFYITLLKPGDQGIINRQHNERDPSPLIVRLSFSIYFTNFNPPCKFWAFAWLGMF